MEIRDHVKEELQAAVDPEKAVFLPKFFKTQPGGYGEGDMFLGVTVPKQRTIAKRYFKDIGLGDLTFLLQDAAHESRLTALFMLVYKFEKAKTDAEKKDLAGLYLENLDYVNNWDLVDSSADKILGAYLFTRNKDVLYELARSGHLWKQRVAIMATFYFIRQGAYQDTLKIAEILLHHEHDLIHKAVGWMLREVGKKDFAVEYHFLQENYKAMPRTMLRYAIEKFSPELRKKFLLGQISSDTAQPL
jgi:3-methyladenine DNA glycosylase AlkD